MAMEHKYQTIKDLAFSKAKIEIEREAGRVLRAVYTPSVMDMALRTHSSTTQTMMLSLIQSKDEPTRFTVARGAEVLGAQSLSIEDIVSMDGVQKGKLTVHGKNEVSELVRRLQNELIISPGKVIDYNAVINEMSAEQVTPEKVDYQAESVGMEHQSQHRRR